jgi:Uma2 family endonuclease
MGEPAWAIATLFPSQGSWSDEEYLAFSTERPLVELCDCAIEVLPMPTDGHQRVLDALFLVMANHARVAGGRARTAGIRVRIKAGVFRQPDIVYLGAARQHLRGEEYWMGADLVVEVVSGSSADRVRDLVTKRREYAEAGVLEYWIVDPQQETITVLQLDGDAYVEHGVYERESVATSVVLPGLSVPVSEALDAQ